MKKEDDLDSLISRTFTAFDRAVEVHRFEPSVHETGRVKSIGSIAKDSDEAAEQLRERQSKFDRGARITYLFGLASVTTFILAVLTLAIR
jgi:hypothetical protein